MEDNKNKILVVDDEDVIRNVCYRSLSSRGYDVELAENGIKALELLRRKTVDVVFTDFKMPIMNGIELLEAIKRDHPHVQVIIMTAFATIESAIYAMKNGAYDFILKPVKPDQIRLVALKCFEMIHLNEENKALKAANQKLTELQSMKNKFIAITSHELRTPVSHLKGYMGILNDAYYYELSEEEKKQCLQVIMNAISDLEHMVMNMHNLIHLENGKADLRTKDVNIFELLAQCVNVHELICKKRNQKLVFKRTNSRITVRADESQVKAVVNELIQNAIKFTKDGGEIVITAEGDSDFCVIKVKDNGIGIEESEKGKIFEKFYEVQNSDYHSSSKDAFMGGGLGLGLSHVQAIVEAHGGGVKVKSKKGKGSEFLVYLPMR